MTRTHWISLGFSVLLALVVPLAWDSRAPAPAADAPVPDIRGDAHRYAAG
jgi:cytochrome b561